MKKEFGENLRVEIYGESHSDRIGVIVKGLPKGAEFDREKLADFMARRAPGKKGGNQIADSAATARKEPDRVVFLRGIRRRTPVGRSSRGRSWRPAFTIPTAAPGITMSFGRCCGRGMRIWART